MYFGKCPPISPADATKFFLFLLLSVFNSVHHSASWFSKLYGHDRCKFQTLNAYAYKQQALWRLWYVAFVEDFEFQSMIFWFVGWIGAYCAVVCVYFRSSFGKYPPVFPNCCLWEQDSSFLLLLALTPVHRLASRFIKLYGHDQCKFQMLKACIQATGSLKTLIFGFWVLVNGKNGSPISLNCCLWDQGSSFLSFSLFKHIHMNFKILKLRMLKACIPAKIFEDFGI